MKDLREEHAAREAEVWAELEAALSKIPEDRWAEPGVLPGWSVKELLWHVAGWIDEAVVYLEQIREGTYSYDDEDDATVDAKNAGFAEAARAMETTAVREGLNRVRDRARGSWEELPQIDDAAIEWFAGETYQHYREHISDLERFAG